MKALILGYDGSEKEVTLPEEQGAQFESVMETVQGMVAQHVLPNGKIMYINEEGKVMDLPINYKATNLAKKILKIDEYILGNAVIVEAKK
jgi:hypothetical protein